MIFFFEFFGTQPDLAESQATHPSRPSQLRLSNGPESLFLNLASGLQYHVSRIEIKEFCEAENGMSMWSATPEFLDSLCSIFGSYNLS